MQIAITQVISSLLRRVALALTLAAGSSMASAGVVHVAIDTSHFGPATGFIEMQFAGGGGPLATALVNNMVGFDSAVVVESWGVTPVSGGYLFRNDIGNDLFQSITFGGILAFDLTFAGTGFEPLGTYVSRFLVSAWDENNTPLGNYDPSNSALAAFNWIPARTANGDGSLSFQVSDLNVTVVPEPSDLLLLGMGLVAMALALRLRARGALVGWARVPT